MKSLKKVIEKLVRNTDWKNFQIHKYLNSIEVPCSKRSVRRYANPIREQLSGGAPETAPKILLFDIETSPMEVFVWQLKTYGWINPDMIIKDWSILTWSAKWLFDSKMHHSQVSPREAVNRQDGSVLKPLWDLLDEANIVIAHNGAQFDVKKMNARFALNGYAPPMPYRVIDTLRVTKRTFNFSAYKLDYINELFGLGTKGHPGMQCWKDCVSGVNTLATKSLIKMSNYCDNDVRILEELYLELRPWIKSHPNVALFIDTKKTVCTNCGSSNLDWKGKYFTPAGRFKAFRCQCGAIGRSRISDLTPEQRKLLNLSVAS